MVLCLIVGCANKTGKSRGDKEKTRFFRVPRVITNQGEFFEELTSTRRRWWISAISRDDLTEVILENDRVCSKHFVSGEPAEEWDRFNVDWIPTQNLGHTKLQVDHEKVAERANRATLRRKRRQDQIEIEVADKARKINVPGKPVEEIFPDVQVCATHWDHHSSSETASVCDHRSSAETANQFLNLDVAQCDPQSLPDTGICAETMVNQENRSQLLVDKETQTNLVSSCTLRGSLSKSGPLHFGSDHRFLSNFAHESILV